LPKLLERPTLITFGLPALIYTVVEIANQNLSHCGLSKHVPGLGAVCCKSDINKLSSDAWRRLTILTLDDDVAAALERLRRNGRIGPETTAMKRCLVASATWASAVDLGNRCARER
jgi:hypothetical protein